MSIEKLMSIALKSKEITIGGDSYLVKEMNAKDAGVYENSLYKIVGEKVTPNAENAKAKLVLFTLCDMDGKRIFQDKDISQVQELPTSIVNMVYKVANSLNAIDRGQIEKN